MISALKDVVYELSRSRSLGLTVGYKLKSHWLSDQPTGLQLILKDLSFFLHWLLTI